jgi:hypothetical protein
MVLVPASDTAPFRAKALPTRFAVVPKLTLVSATTLPFIALPFPSVAELPTCQYTFFAWAPLASTTDPDVATVRADPAWNTYVPVPLSVTTPVKLIPEPEQ